ncbi:MAG: MFS transporter [Pseudomonadota bacterium]
MNRWSILAILVAARTVMAMQYQVIGALSPFLIEGFGIGLAEIGVLIGLYVLPGVIFAIPGSAIGQRFGEKPVVIAATGLMAAGALLMASTSNYTVFHRNVDRWPSREPQR